MNRRASSRFRTGSHYLAGGAWSLTALAVVLAVLPVGAIVASAPAYACTDSDDVNVLCSNEQAFIDDLARAGVTPTQTPRIMVNRGNQLCGQLASGVPRDVVVQKVYGGAALRLSEAQAIVTAAVDHLCVVSAAPGPTVKSGAGGGSPAPTATGPVSGNSPSYQAGQEAGQRSGYTGRDTSALDAQGWCANTIAAIGNNIIATNPLRGGIPWSGGQISLKDFNMPEYVSGCVQGIQAAR